MEYGLGTPVGECCGCSSPDTFPQTAITIQCDCNGRVYVAQSDALDCSLLKVANCPQQLVVTSVTFSGSWSKSSYSCLSQCCYDGCNDECTGCHIYSDTTGTGANTSVTVSVSNGGEIRITTTITGTTTTDVGSNYVCTDGDGNVYSSESGLTAGSPVTESYGGEVVFRVICTDPSADGCDGQFRIVAENHLLMCDDPCQNAACDPGCNDGLCAGLSCCDTCTVDVTYVFENLDGEPLWTHTHTYSAVPCLDSCAVCDGECSCACGGTCSGAGASSAEQSFAWDGLVTLRIGFE